MNIACTRLVAAIAFGLTSASSFANTLITFEEATGLSAMQNSFVAVPLTARLDIQYLSEGALFSSTSAFVALVDHFPPNPLATPSPPNIVGGTSASGVLDYSAPVVVTFVVPGNASLDATTSFVSVLGDRFPDRSGTITMTAYGLTGNILGSVTAADTGPVGTGATLSLSLAGIHRVVLSNTNGTSGYDNLTFGPLVPVPEPPVSMLLLAGLAGTLLLRTGRHTK